MSCPIHRGKMLAVVAALCALSTYLSVCDAQSVCTVASYADFATCVTSTNILISGPFTVPAEQTVDFSKLQSGTKVSVVGTVTWAHSTTLTSSSFLFTLGGTSITFDGTNGIFDGSGQLYWDTLGGNGGSNKPKFFRVSTKQSTIRGLTILNAPIHCFSVSGSDNVLDGITLDNSAGDALLNNKKLGHNTDAFDVSATNIIVQNSWVHNQDDCLAINKGTNIQFLNNTCIGGHGISIGSINSNSIVDGVTVNDCRIINSDNGARIKTVSGATNGAVSNVVYSNIVLSNIANYGIVIEQDYLNGGPTGIPTSGIPITNLTMSNISGTMAQNFRYSTYILCAACSQFDFSNINITPVTPNCTGITPLPDGCLKSSPTTTAPPTTTTVPTTISTTAATTASTTTTTTTTRTTTTPPTSTTSSRTTTTTATAPISSTTTAQTTSITTTSPSTRSTSTSAPSSSTASTAVSSSTSTQIAPSATTTMSSTSTTSAGPTGQSTTAGSTSTTSMPLQTSSAAPSVSSTASSSVTSSTLPTSSTSTTSTNSATTATTQVSTSSSAITSTASTSPYASSSSTSIGTASFSSSSSSSSPSSSSSSSSSPGVFTHSSNPSSSIPTPPNHCASEFCSSHGVCKLSWFGGAYCVCSAGYAGTDCQTAASVSAASACENGGTYDSTSGVCTCPAGWFANDCSIAFARFSFELAIALNDIVNSTQFEMSVEQQCQWAIRTLASASISDLVQCSLETFMAAANPMAVVHEQIRNSVATGVDVYVDLFSINATAIIVAMDAISRAAAGHLLNIDLGSNTAAASQITVQPNSDSSSSPASASSSSKWSFWSEAVIIVVACGGVALLLLLAVVAVLCYQRKHMHKFDLDKSNIQLPSYHSNYDSAVLQGNPLQQSTLPATSSTAGLSVQAWHATV